VKRIVWFLLAVVIVALGIWAWSRVGDARISKDLEGLYAIDDPQEAVASAAGFLRNHPDLDEHRRDEAVSIILNSTFEAGEFDGLISTVDSLLTTPLPPPVVSRLNAELHDALVIRSGIFGSEEDAARAGEIARRFLTVRDLPGGSYLMMASIRADMLGDAAPTADHWLTVELARRGSAEMVGESDAIPELTLDSAHRALLWHIAATSGLDAALALADSIAGADDDPTLAAVIDANRYRLAVDTDPELAQAAARDLAARRGALGGWRIPNEIGRDLVERELDLDLALELSEWSLSLARSRPESGMIYDGIGLAYQAMGNYEEAAASFEAAVERLDNAPAFEDAEVQHLLEAYETLGEDVSATGLLALIIARSVLPNEEARGMLAGLLTRSGQPLDTMPDLIASFRYADVEQAPDVTVIAPSGETVALADLRGEIVLLCFWSYT
jgi:hypothetical protein